MPITLEKPRQVSIPKPESAGGGARIPTVRTAVGYSGEGQPDFSQRYPVDGRFGKALSVEITNGPGSDGSPESVRRLIMATPVILR